MYAFVRGATSSESDGNPMPPAVSLTADAFQQLREDIIRGRIRPNQHLVAAEVAERLQISRTPGAGGVAPLGIRGPGRGHQACFVVREHNTEEIREIYQVRAALEDMAARLTAEHASDEAIESIEALVLTIFR